MNDLDFQYFPDFEGDTYFYQDPSPFDGCSNGIDFPDAPLPMGDMDFHMGRNAEILNWADRG